MRSVYSLTVEYDDELKCLLVSYVQRLNDLTIEKMIDNGIDDLFIRRIYYFARLVLQTYVNAVNNDTDADTAIFEAEEEICETDIVCVRSNDGSCMIAGVFKKHGRAVDFMKERLSAA